HAQTSLSQESSLVGVGVTIARNQANKQLAAAPLAYLCLADVDHILKNVIEPPELRSVFQNDIVFQPAIDTGYNTAGPPARATAIRHRRHISHFVSKQRSRPITKVSSDDLVTGPISAGKKLDPGKVFIYMKSAPFALRDIRYRFGH